MDLKELELEFEKLGNYKTKDVDRLNKRLIRENTDVSFLKDIIIDREEFHRTYFQVSLGKLKTIDEQLEFIEDNYYLLNDWWHVDQLPQFLKGLNFDLAYKKARVYCESKHTFLRRWGYVMFMPKLVKEESSFEKIVGLLKNDDEYYCVMAQAWLISYLAVYYPLRTFEFIKNNKELEYNIIGRAIQKICDSFRISDEYKDKFKSLRSNYK